MLGPRDRLIDFYPFYMPQCLGTTSTPANGVPLYHIPCTDPNNKFNGAWEIAPGNNQGVKLSGTNFCLDAGSSEFHFYFGIQVKYH